MLVKLDLEELLGVLVFDKGLKSGFSYSVKMNNFFKNLNMGSQARKFTI